MYDREGKLIKKKETPKEGYPQTTYYEYPETGNTVVKFRAGGQAVTSHSKTDSFGRKVFDELQLDLGFVSRQFSYHKGEATNTHTAQGKLKSSPTTQLVSRIEFSDGRLMSYEYDQEERITKVTDSLNGVDKVTLYTYDALGQLTSETVDGTVVNVMEYDNYGNIKAKNGVAYTYGDSIWKDLLTKVGEQTISYDEQGNPTSYLGHSLTWEKGRQLKSFDGHTYTYNANGIRTSKTVNGVKHNYTLEGSKVLRETWGTNDLVTLFDNEENVCGLVYNDEPYYFMKNLQGDVIAITDRSGTVVARYSYDAWGVCTIEQDSAYCIGVMNPYRYRGYYYDSEIGMYYLQSRYYDPAVGRFVNADEMRFISCDFSIATNLNIYCLNNPINYVDSSGFFGTPIQWVCAAIGGIAGWIFGDFVARGIGLFPGKWWQWQTVAYWAVRGLVVVGGAVLGYVAGTKLLNIITKFVYNKGIAYKLPRIVQWFLGITSGGPLANELYQDMLLIFSHMST